MKKKGGMSLINVWGLRLRKNELTPPPPLIGRRLVLKYFLPPPSFPHAAG